MSISLDAKLAASDGGAIVRDIKKEIDDAQAKCRRCDGARRVSLRGEVRELLNLQPATYNLQPATQNRNPKA